MEEATTYRATMHAGRCHMENGRSTGLVFSNKHNDRNYDIHEAENINTERVKENLYYIIDEHGEIIPKPENTTFDTWELKMYNHYYGDWLEKQTQRHKDAGHESRVRTMPDVLKSARQAPREEVLSIGNFTNQCNDEAAFIDVVHEYVRALQTNYPRVRVLNYAIHRDEEVHRGEDENGEVKGEKSNIHCHLRICFVYENPSGDYEPNQTQALGAMGIQAPKPEEKISRYNNPIQTMTQQCRTLYIDIATQHGFHIETEPASPGKTTLNKQEFVAQELKRENAELKTEQAELRQQNTEISRQNDELRTEVNALKTEVKGLRALLRRWKRILTPIKNLFTKLSEIRVNAYKSALDEILLDANTAPAYDALKELDTLSDLDEVCI